ncbi:MAG: FKBP-type peptidyl-prolyl cis-trans isomerase [Muribaculaceae bacterium]|nr:FKBP-type peptidyl-prolyl cis-trans isomerase [Muribaculaceae bacterium]MDE6532818.1 FKBP-type peptidyl-prolyl cis-trans isomerase [Muribaculaceae bacterium]
METAKETVGPGKFVAYSYKLYNDADGSLLFEAPANAPDVMVYGVSHEIVPGLAAAMKDLAKGDKFEVTLPPAAAFGDRNDEYLLTLDREIFMRDGELAEEVKEGAILPMMTAEGYRVQGVVTEVGDKIKMDFNHPFAGLTVRYEGKVEEVRDATPEELQPSKGCGGGCGGGCDCGSEGDCATGCGGGSCGSCH